MNKNNLYGNFYTFLDILRLRRKFVKLWHFSDVGNFQFLLFSFFFCMGAEVMEKSEVKTLFIIF